MIKGHLSIKYKNFTLDTGHFTFLKRESILGISGPSGSGKTTFLRCLAGLESKHCKGFLEFQGEVWQDSKRKILVPAYKRSIGHIFQEKSLFPHLSVKENLLFGYKNITKREKKFDLDGIIEQLKLEKIIYRDIYKLSGGEKQRVTIGRTLLASPRIIFMDEALTGLDDRSKMEIYPYIKELPVKWKIGVIFVTHNIAEMKILSNKFVSIDLPGKIMDL